MSNQIQVRLDADPEVVKPIMKKHGMSVIDVSDKSVLFGNGDSEAAYRELISTSEGWAVDLV